MENKINIAELLKDCPQGMELDCSIWDNVVFDHIDTTSNYPIYIKKMGGELEYLTEDGHFNFDCDAKCVIFPKGKTTWEGFVPPCKFEDGKIVATSNGLFIGIIKVKNNRQVGAYCSIDYSEDFRINSDYWFDRMATEDEKEKLFDAIKEHGYKWNSETKTLEKLVEPKFKVGDRIKQKGSSRFYIISSIESDRYRLNNNQFIRFVDEKIYELVPNKFDINTLKPFESRVLVRDYDHQCWRVSFFGYFDKFMGKFDTVRGVYIQCIPYEGNEHLLNTNKDCDEYFKNW